MRFGFQHLAPYAGHESTLLRFGHDGQTDCVLVDAGAGVDLDDHLGDGEYLSAVLLTHAHIDHYRSLGKNLRHRAPIYASPDTAAALEHSLSEATKDNDVGDVAAVLDHLEPIDDWTSLVDGLDVEVAPVPAGHTVGAAGFLVRFQEDDVPDPQHVLLTGDFTRRPCAGNPGLSADLPYDLKAAFVNVSTNGGFEETATAAVEAILERALGGGRVVVATSGLTGVHLAYLLGHAARAVDRRLPVRIVGQAAKLYDALAYDVPGVEPVRTFAQTAEVLDAGTVTIAGPETPTKGSTKRLFAAIRDEPAALFAQVTTSGVTVPDGTTCATAHFEFGNHPSWESLVDFVETLSPENVVVKHTRNARRFRDEFPDSFVWASNETRRYDLYADGEWLRPEWMAAASIRTIEMARYGDGVIVPDAAGEAIPAPSLARRDPDLAAEGVDLERLRERFALGSSTTGGAPSADGSAAGDGGTVMAADGTSTTGAMDEGPAMEATTGTTGETAAETAAEDGSFRAAVLDRLDAIEDRLAAVDLMASETVLARVLRGDDDVTLLQVREEVEVPDGAVVRVTIEGVDDAEPDDDGPESVEADVESADARPGDDVVEPAGDGAETGDDDGP